MGDGVTRKESGNSMVRNTITMGGVSLIVKKTDVDSPFIMDLSLN